MQRLIKLLPPNVVGYADYRLRPHIASAWGGPLNGQVHRQEIVRQLIELVPFDSIVETGTFRGTTTEYFASFGTPVYTAEIQERYFEYARHRLAKFTNVQVSLSDSRTFLSTVPATGGIPFIYLDAHWENDLPLPEELDIIAKRFPSSIVLIDDFQVPRDADYGYDNYGPGKALTTDILPLDGVLKGWGLFYPSASAREETGAKRGCVLLTSPDLTERVTTDATSVVRDAERGE